MANVSDGAISEVMALHPSATVRFVDDDGAQHAPVLICETCRVRYPCPTLEALWRRS